MNISCASYNFFLNGQSQEPSYFFMFGRDIYIPTLANMLQSKLRYLADTSSMLSIDMLREGYVITAITLKKPAKLWKM